MRSVTVLGGLAAVALALLAALVLFARTDEDPSEPTAATPSTDASTAVLADSLPTEPALAGERHSEAPAQRDALATQAAPAPTCLVRVVAAGSGAPLPGAHLWIQNDDVRVDSPQWWRAMRRFNDVEPVLAGGLGSEVVLDERGEVRVPRPSRTLVVAAARGELHGSAALERGAETCVVELKPYHSLTVEVVDRGGRPVAGAPVVFFWGEPDPLEDSNTLPADEHGQLAIAKLEDQVYEHDHRGPVRVTLAGGVPCEPELVEFTLDALPHAPVRFVARDFGSVIVQVTDAQGRALPLEGTTSLEVETDAIVEPSLALLAGTSLELPLESGMARFPCVRLGAQLELGCTPKGHASEWRSVTGPTSAGEEQRVLVPLGERLPIVRGRVIGTTDAGVLHCIAPALRSPYFSRHSYTRLVEDGSFEFTVESYGDLERFAGAWELRFEHAGSPTSGACVTPRLDRDTKEIDFGEVVLQPLASLARVRVVDEGGAPVQALVEVRSTAGASQWSAADGTYLLEGRPEELPLRLRATHESWLPSAWAEIAASGAETTLVLRRGATLVGRLRLPREANPQSCEVELGVVPDDPAAEEQEQHDSPANDGRFRFEGCEPGVGRLVVRYDDLLVLERPGIELAAGATTDLADIELGLHPFALTFALASGAAWSGGHLEVREPDGPLTAWIQIGPNASAFLLAVRPTLDLWVAGHGARPKLFEGVVDGDRLELPSAPSVVLRLAREIPLPAAPLALVVRAVRTKPEEVAFETDDDTDGGDAAIGADGLVRLSVPWPGEYELAWCVRHAGTGAEFDIDPREPQTVTVDDSSAASIVDVGLTLDVVARAMLAAEGR